jgi:hypothetical protein
MLLLFMLAKAASGDAQQMPPNLDPNSEDGRLLLEIGEEEQETKKIELMHRFVAKFPRHEELPWVLIQLQPACLKHNQFQKALETGEMLIAIVPDHLEAAYNGLRAAEAVKDPALIRRWAGRTWQISRKVAAEPRPERDEEAALWQDRIEYAKSLHLYSEYALYAAALAAADAKTRIELLRDLEQRNPRSPYLSQLASQYYTAFRQLGDIAQSVSLAEKNVKEGRADEDMLTLLTVYHHQRNDIEKTLYYAAKTIELLSGKGKPERVAPEEWEKKKALALGNAHYLKGVIYSEQERFAEADRALRAALPHIQYDDYVRASALFHLGWANYKLGEQSQSPGLIKEALRFNSLCASIRSPFRQQALKNLEAIKLEFDLQ